MTNPNNKQNNNRNTDYSLHNPQSPPENTKVRQEIMQPQPKSLPQAYIIAVSEPLIVIEQKFIDKQVAYLIVNGSGTKREWVKLWTANKQQTEAIMKYEKDKNNGVQPIYYPQAEMMSQQEQEDQYQYRHSSRLLHSGLENSPLQLTQQQKIRQSTKYNLRERELLLISKNQFYGLRALAKEEKKEHLPTNRQKKEIKKEEVKVSKRNIKKGGSRPDSASRSRNKAIKNNNMSKSQKKQFKQHQIFNINSSDSNNNENNHIPTISCNNNQNNNHKRDVKNTNKDFINDPQNEIYNSNENESVIIQIKQKKETISKDCNHNKSNINRNTRKNPSNKLVINLQKQKQRKPNRKKPIKKQQEFIKQEKDKERDLAKEKIKNISKANQKRKQKDRQGKQGYQKTKEKSKVIQIQDISDSEIKTL